MLCYRGSVSNADLEVMAVAALTSLCTSPLVLSDTTEASGSTSVGTSHSITAITLILTSPPDSTDMCIPISKPLNPNYLTSWHTWVCPDRYVQDPIVNRITFKGNACSFGSVAVADIYLLMND